MVLAPTQVQDFEDVWVGAELHQNRDFSQTSLRVCQGRKCIVDFLDTHPASVSFVDGFPDGAIVAPTHLLNKFKTICDHFVDTVPPDSLI